MRANLIFFLVLLSSTSCQFGNNNTTQMSINKWESVMVGVSIGVIFSLGIVFLIKKLRK